MRNADEMFSCWSNVWFLCQVVRASFAASSCVLNLYYVCNVYFAISLQVLEAVKSQTKPVTATEKILMAAIKKFLPLVLATRDKDGWLWSSWVANEQTQLIIDSKKEVSRRGCYFIPSKTTFQNLIYISILVFSQINLANDTFKTAAFRYSFKVDLYAVDCFHLNFIIVYFVVSYFSGKVPSPMMLPSSKHRISKRTPGM